MSNIRLADFDRDRCGQRFPHWRCDIGLLANKLRFNRAWPANCRWMGVRISGGKQAERKDYQP